MRVKWRYSAVSDITHIRDYIAERSPSAADAIVSRALHSIDNLAAFPKSGRRGQVTGTREVVVGMSEVRKTMTLLRNLRV